MVDYNLLPNEGLLLKNEAVLHPIGNKIGNFGELILTNLNLVYIRKGPFGGVKEILKFPVSQIKIVDEKPQIFIGKHNASNQIEIFYINGHEMFVFPQSSKREVLKWLDKISELLTGHEADIDISERNTIPGFTVATDLLKNTIGTFKEVFKEKQNVTNRCTSCGALISGIKGEVKKCEYCGVEQTLK